MKDKLFAILGITAFITLGAWYVSSPELGTSQVRRNMQRCALSKSKQIT